MKKFIVYTVVFCLCMAGSAVAEKEQPKTQISMTDALSALKSYEFNQSMRPLKAVDELLREATGDNAPLEKIEEAFIAFLRSDATLDAKRFICKKLSIIGTSKSTEVLGEMLAVPETFEMALYALKRIPGQEAEQVLLNTTPGKTGAELVGLITALSLRGNSETVALLGGYIYHADPVVAQAAISGLGNIGTQMAVPILAVALESATGKRRTVVIDAYLRCAERLFADGERTQAEQVYRRLWLEKETPVVRAAALRGLVKTLDWHAAEMVVAGLQSPEKMLQKRAAGCIEALTDRRAFERVAEALSDYDTPVQVLVLEAFARAGARSVLPVVRTATDAPEISVRLAALRALSALGDRDAVLMLAKRAVETTGEESATARQSLSHMRGRVVEEEIVDLIRTANAPVRVVLMETVAVRKIASATPVLLENARHPEADLRQAAYDALQAAAPTGTMPALVNLYLEVAGTQEAEPVSEVILTVARRIQNRDGRVAALLEAYPQAGSGQPGLLIILGKIGAPTALPVLREALEGSADLRNAAIVGLSAWSDATPLDDLLGMARQLAGTPQVESALRGFVRLAALADAPADTDLLAMYKEAVGFATTVSAKETLLEGLLRIQGDTALQLVTPMLDDADTAVVLAAIKTLNAWDDDAPIARLEQLAQNAKTPVLQSVALEGYVRMIGLNPDRPVEKATAMYRNAIGWAEDDAAKKQILAALSKKPTVGAFQLAAELLQEPALRAEAEVAVVKMAAHLAGSCDGSKAILESAMEKTDNEYVRTEATRLLAQLAKFDDYITAWQLSGPYAIENIKRDHPFFVVFAPEPEAENVEGMIPWALLPVGVKKDDETPFILSLDDHLDGEYGVAYLRTVVCSEKAQKVRLELGSSAGVKVWLNGELAHKYNSDQDCTPNFEQVEVNLKEGRNPLLLKVVQGRGHWEVCARFRMGDDAPVPGLRFEPMGK